MNGEIEFSNPNLINLRYNSCSHYYVITHSNTLRQNNNLSTLQNNKIVTNCQNWVAEDSVLVVQLTVSVGPERLYRAHGYNPPTLKQFSSAHLGSQSAHGTWNYSTAIFLEEIKRMETVTNEKSIYFIEVHQVSTHNISSKYHQIVCWK